MRDRCIVCGGARTTVVFTEFDTDILRCRDCGHVFSSHEAEQDYNGYFGADEIVSEEQHWWKDAHERMYRDFCDRFLAGGSGRLLDVGCGLGYFVEKVSSCGGWEAYGYEISEPAVRFARDRLGLANVSLGLVQESGFPEKHFDIATLWDVIEHIPDPDPLLSYLSHILKDDGLLFMHTGNASIQVPKAKLKRLIKGMRPGLHYLEAKDHVNIYSVSTMRRVLTRNGFDSVRFAHLHPVQSVAGGRNPLMKFAKNAWFNLAKALCALTGGKLNLDNLHVVARKRAAR